jgi:hypothetical protein
LFYVQKLDINNEGPTVSNEQVTNDEVEESFSKYNAPPPGQLYSSSFNPYQVTNNDRQQSIGFNPYQVNNDTQQSIGFNPYPMRMEQKQFYQQGGQQFSTLPSSATISTGFPQYSTNDKYNHYDNVSPPQPSYSSGGRFNINPVQRHNNSNHGFFPRAHV